MLDDDRIEILFNLKQTILADLTYLSSASPSLLRALDFLEGTMAKAMPDQKAGEAATAAANPIEFHVYGPRNLPCTNWRDLLNSSWSVYSLPSQLHSPALSSPPGVTGRLWPCWM
jgi:hypothetical protein